MLPAAVRLSWVEWWSRMRWGRSEVYGWPSTAPMGRLGAVLFAVPALRGPAVPGLGTGKPGPSLSPIYRCARASEDTQTFMPSRVRRPALSVVIVSRGAAVLAKALSCLSAAARRLDGDVEVVVVFDGVATRSLEAGFAFAFRPLVLVRSGLPAARNAGWRAARSDLILFLDDDVIASPDLLTAHLQVHAAHPGALAVGLVTEVPQPASAWGDYEMVAVERRWRRLLEGRPGPVRVSMSNASVSRACLERAGGFAGWMPSEEDIELGFRLQSAGSEVVFTAAAAAERRSGRGFKEWRALARTRGRMDVAIYRSSAESGGTASLLATFGKRHPLTKSAIRLAFLSAGVERSLLGSAGWLGIGAHRAGLKRLSRAGLSLVANIEYWSGVREGLRGRVSFAAQPRAAGRGAAGARPVMRPRG
jgi:GT2 family glycosyltransferase